MFLSEPPPTQFDLHFQLLGVRVRVSPWFWLLALILGWGLTGGNGVQILMWIAAVFLSILVHEFGHVLAFQRVGIQAHIVLYHFGGLAIPESSSFTSFSSGGFGRQLNAKQQIFVSAAGPAAQLALAALVLLLVRVSGHYITLPQSSPEAVAIQWETPAYGQDQESKPVDSSESEDPQTVVPPTGQGESFAEEELRRLVYERLPFHAFITGKSETFMERGAKPLTSAPINNMAFYIVLPSIFWALLNLVPVYPLDGGQISRELFVLYSGSNGVAHSLMLSIACGAGLALWGFVSSQLMLAIMFAMLAYQSYMILQAYQGRGGGFGGKPW